MIDSLSLFTLIFLYDSEIMFSLCNHRICLYTQVEVGGNILGYLYLKLKKVLIQAGGVKLIFKLHLSLNNV